MGRRARTLARYLAASGLVKVNSVRLSLSGLSIVGSAGPHCRREPSGVLPAKMVAVSSVEPSAGKSLRVQQGTAAGRGPMSVHGTSDHLT